MSTDVKIFIMLATFNHRVYIVFAVTVVIEMVAGQTHGEFSVLIPYINVIYEHESAVILYFGRP